MRIKVYLKPSRDIELIAVRYNPTLDFGGIAREVLRSYVRGETFKFHVPKNSNYMKRPMICYVTLDEKEDADVIEYLEDVVIARSALIRNLMLRSIENNMKDIYIDSTLMAAVISQELEQKRQTDLKRLRKKLEMK